VCLLVVCRASGGIGGGGARGGAGGARQAVRIRLGSAHGAGQPWQQAAHQETQHAATAAAACNGSRSTILALGDTSGPRRA
jgi:hypothetical protein